MENKPSCPFQQVCICFNDTLCFSTSIDSKECGGPQIMGRRIVAIADISSGNHKIAIISQCPKCEKILGVVTGDTEPIPYRPDSVVLSAKMKEKIPQVICQSCVGQDAENYAYPNAPQQQVTV